MEKRKVENIFFTNILLRDENFPGNDVASHIDARRGFFWHGAKKGIVELGTSRKDDLIDSVILADVGAWTPDLSVPRAAMNYNELPLFTAFNFPESLRRVHSHKHFKGKSIQFVLAEK